MSNSAPTTIEKFAAAHLSHITVEPYGKVPPAAQGAAVRPSALSTELGNRRFGLLGRAVVVFMCGMAAGYLLSGAPHFSPVGATQARSGFAPSSLRIDYDLRHH